MLLPKIISIALCSRIIFILFALGTTFIIPLDTGYVGKQSDPNTPYLAWVWANFDGRHLIDIAQNGYQKTNFAYFPLYPFLISVVSKILPIPLLYVGIAISTISFIASMIIIQKIILLDYKQKTASLALLFLSVFPLSFFYHSVYTDSLFLLLTTSSFYFARKKKWIIAGIFGNLATLTRFSGLALIPALATEWYLQNKNNLRFKKAIIPILLPAVGLLTYMAYLKMSFGDPFLFQKSFSAWNQQNLTFPLQVFFRYLKIFIFVDKTLLVYWVAVLEFASVVIYFALSFYVFKKVRASYGIFMMSLLSLVAFTGTFAGTPRYILHLFPAFIGLALLLHARARLRLAILLLFLILGFVLTGLFTRGYFIT